MPWLFTSFSRGLASMTIHRAFCHSPIISPFGRSWSIYLTISWSQNGPIRRPFSSPTLFLLFALPFHPNSSRCDKDRRGRTQEDRTWSWRRIRLSARISNPYPDSRFLDRLPSGGMIVRPPLEWSRNLIRWPCPLRLPPVILSRPASRPTSRPRREDTNFSTRRPTRPPFCTTPMARPSPRCLGLGSSYSCLEVCENRNYW